MRPEQRRELEIGIVRSVRWKRQRWEAEGGGQLVHVVFWESWFRSYIGDIYSQRPNVWSRQVLNRSFIIQGITGNVHNKPASLHIQRKRSCEGQLRVASNDHDLKPATVPCALGPPRLPTGLSLLVASVHDHARGQDHKARQQLVS